MSVEEASPESVLDQVAVLVTRRPTSEIVRVPLISWVPPFVHGTMGPVLPPGMPRNGTFATHVTLATPESTDASVQVEVAFARSTLSVVEEPR